MNPSGTGAPERELRRRKGSRTLESHLHGGKIKRTGGISRCREECSSKLEYGKADQEPNGPSELWAQSPKIETPGWGLGTESSAPEVSPRERAGGCLGGGWAPRPRLQRLVPGLGGRGRAETAWEVSKPFDGQRLPGRLENKAVAEEGSNTPGVGKWNATSEGTWEKSLVCASAGEGRKEGVSPHRIPPMPQQAYGPTSYWKAVLPSVSPPPTPTTSYALTDLGLPAIQEGWPQQLPEAYHRRGCPCTGLLALWRGYTSTEQHQTPPAP